MIFDAHVNGANGTDKLDRKLFLEMIERKSVELDMLADYQIPHGDLKQAQHKLSCSGLANRPIPLFLLPDQHKFCFEAYMLNVIEAMLPGLKSQVLAWYYIRTFA